jgi:hypothetical protein
MPIKMLIKWMKNQTKEATIISIKRKILEIRIDPIIKEKCKSNLKKKKVRI